MKSLQLVFFTFLMAIFCCNTYAQELYAHSNAASIINETNSTTGWTNFGSTTIGVTDFEVGGPLSIVLAGNSGVGFNAAQTTISGLTSNQQYNVVIRALSHEGNVDAGWFFGWSGIQETINTTMNGNGWQDYQFPVTSDGGDLVINIYVCDCSNPLEKIYIDYISITPISGSDNQSSELYTEFSAAAKLNESNSFGSWSNDYWLTLESSDVYEGNYALKVGGKNAGAYELSGLTINSIPGETYTIQGYAKVNVVNNQGMDFLGFTNVIINTSAALSTTYSPFQFTGEATGNQFTIQAYGSLGTPTTDYLLLDNLTITVGSNVSDTQPPTPPTLSGTNQTETTANLTWNESTDNTAVTGYRIFKDGILETTITNVTTYQVTGLNANTAYTFTIRAIDAAGNESANSNTVSVTTDTTSGGGSSSGNDSWTKSGSNVSVAITSDNVAIGRSNVPNGYKLAVEGKVRTREVRVDQDTWPDYVFHEDYRLLSLEEIQKHIKEKGHLPNIPSAKDVQTNGIELGEMNKLLLEKIEELTLHAIKQQAIIESMQKEIRNLKVRNDEK